jgi:hypothetical protein
VKNILIAAGLLAVSATAASAQFAPRPYTPGQHSYERRHHRECEDKAIRLHQFERRAASDGRIDRRERAIMADLERDLRITCGGHRYR